MGEVVVVDYGVCNLDSIARAIEECGATPLVSSDPSDLRRGDGIVLPGVGAFSAAMENLKARGFDKGLREELERRPVPLLGICLGMQLLAERSLEGGETQGLGLIEGEVTRLEPTEAEERVPHMGWNEVDPTGPSELFDGIDAGTDFYCVHSYHLRVREDHVLARTPYCGGFASAIGRDNLLGVQFHPEKSQRAGFRLLRNFLARCAGGGPAAC